jgi:PAS domain S-box-containing protein
MYPEFLEDRAALYVAGALTAAERENFELVLEFHDEAKARVAELTGPLTACALAASLPVPAPSGRLKQRILGALPMDVKNRGGEAVVVTGADGLVRWVNPAFTDLCGYTLEELKGGKPGRLLQGAETDREAVARIRESVRLARPCRETLVNYHKDGGRYVVDVRIAPILDDAAQPCWFVARERRLPDDALAGAGAAKG